jgi:hypothetical protein
MGGRPGAGSTRAGDASDDIGDDVVGITSARLRADGVTAEARLQALRLLGILEAVAGPDLQVRRELAAVAVEFGIPDAEAERSLERLLAVGAVRSDGDELVLAGAEPPARGGIRLQDFLALVDAHVDAPAPRSSVHRPRLRSIRPLGTLVAAAALVAAVVLVPRGFDGPTTPVLHEEPDLPQPAPVTTTVLGAQRTPSSLHAPAVPTTAAPSTLMVPAPAPEPPPPTTTTAPFDCPLEVPEVLVPPTGADTGAPPLLGPGPRAGDSTSSSQAACPRP